MMMSHKGHLKWMAILAGALFLVMLALGKPVSEAFSYAVVLACPLMMVGMMFGGHGHAGHGGHAAHDTQEAQDRRAAHHTPTD
ncbi:Protein of unknown function [Tessaracoccus oleiagri]|uniref:DUF2933 domain-containing protein n=2 Tax=Tessaracoccus oleiagri TaxID=686624 RepID=A0A1G9HGX5_9ACTN|nr:Protein of unknown function [Tessaracoccus oleiagri]